MKFFLCVLVFGGLAILSTIFVYIFVYMVKKLPEDEQDLVWRGTWITIIIFGAALLSETKFGKMAMTFWIWEDSPPEKDDLAKKPKKPKKSKETALVVYKPIKLANSLIVYKPPDNENKII